MICRERNWYNIVREFEHKIAVITGAAKGIGLAITRQLGEKGAHVCLLDQDEEALRKAGELLDSAGISHEYAIVDITSEEEVKYVFSKLADKHQKIDILVNNAGITKDNLIYKMTSNEWTKVMDVHLKGSFLCSKYAQEWMVKNNYGRIINLSSVSALGNKGQSNYAAAKAGIQGFTKTLAIELGKYNITVNAIAPGFIVTDMTKAVAERMNISFEELKESKISQIPVKRAGTPEDVANAACFFASESSSFVSGQVLYVAGGPKQ
ncbi:SDR family NAD(P)-dependent oxidoreductase [Virgibacillus sp. C22-A2]|uniref:SDR family NAD(P)-dependent oxidoreductase n=1 Tax=Virgibacillus tibetensis TaxID=3042313 RepID=A0ABU6KD41_9BACI|nr:SDR family NAD(P)-dependent oxidoreductase [Virgibacillus sp. C22-A2]